MDNNFHPEKEKGEGEILLSLPLKKLPTKKYPPK